MHERVGCRLQIPRGPRKIANGSWNYRRITVHSSRRISGEIQHYIHMSRPARRFAVAFWSTGFAREHKITAEASLKARYKFGIARTRNPLPRPPETHGVRARS